MEIFLYVFFQELYNFSSSIQVFYPFQLKSFSGVRQSSTFFHRQISSFLNKTILSKLYGLSSFVENIRTIYKVLVLGSIFIPFIYMSVFRQVLYCLGYCSFVICFEIRKGEASSFCLFKTALVIWVLDIPLMNFSMDFFYFLNGKSPRF